MQAQADVSQLGLLMTERLRDGKTDKAVEKELTRALGVYC